MMSADIQEPHLSLSRKEKKNKGNKEESRVEIYENEDTFKQRHTNVRRGRHNNRSAVHRSHFMTVSILGFLYLLILAGTFLRYILATLDKQSLLTEREQLNISLNQAQTSILNLTEERDELQTERDQLNISLNQAQTRILNLTAERDELQRKYGACRRPSLDGDVRRPFR